MYVQGCNFFRTRLRCSVQFQPLLCCVSRCVGRRFAIEEAVLTLTRFFQKFTVRLDKKRHPPGSPIWALTGITFQPAGGIWLQLTPRDAAVSLPEE